MRTISRYQCTESWSSIRNRYIGFEEELNEKKKEWTKEKNEKDQKKKKKKKKKKKGSNKWKKYNGDSNDVDSTWHATFALGCRCCCTALVSSERSEHQAKERERAKQRYCNIGLLCSLSTAGNTRTIARHLKRWDSLRALQKEEY